MADDVHYDTVEINCAVYVIHFPHKWPIFWCRHFLRWK